MSMRFAYIDSQGNEVPIPSVDALALRIELGAIKADTQLYDAQADHWGPADTHEIFHTLSRDVADNAFVAPPPPMAPPPASPEPEPEPEPELVAEAPPEPETEAIVEPVAEAPADDLLSFDLVGDAPAVEPLAEASDAPPSFGSALADDLAAIPGVELPTPEPPAPPAPPADAMGFGDMDLDLAPMDGLESTPTLEESADEASFDFSTGIKLEETEPEGAAPDFGADAPMAFDGGFESGADMAGSDTAMDFAAPPGGIELESPMDFAGGSDVMDLGGDSLGGGSLELETPMSDFTPEQSSSWVDEADPGPVAPREAMDFSRPAAGSTGRESAARPEPKNRPSPPRRKRSRPFPTGLVAGVVGLIVVGGGGYFGWTALQSRGGDADVVEVVLPPVAIPDIPAELLPQMRDIADDALGLMLSEYQARSEALGITPEVNPEWLGGSYLANASSYDDIEAFWLGIERFVDEVRNTDLDVFHAKYVEQVAQTELDETQGALVTERADSGFVAARDGRFEAYSLMDDLVNASLNLHQFLVDNEELIDYDTAASGVSSDPVLEAVPATETLRDEMWALVGGITGALQDLGTLDQVTTERLFAVLFDRMRSAGVR